MGELSAGALATEAFRLIEREKRAVAAWGLIYVAAMTAGLGGVFVFMGSALAPLLIPGQTHDPALLPPLLKSMALVYAVLLPLGLLAQAIMICGVYRAILRPEDRGWFFLRVGADELRMVLVSLLLLIIAALVVLAVAFAVAGAAAAMPGTGWKVLTGLVGGLGGLCLAAWVGVRLCLATPMTFAERRVRLFGSWRLTRGRFWPLLGAFLLAFVLTLAVSTVMQIVVAIIMGLSGGALASVIQAGDFNPAVLARLAAAYRAVGADPAALADTFA